MAKGDFEARSLKGRADMSAFQKLAGWPLYIKRPGATNS